MASALEQLLALRDAGDRFDTPPGDLLPLQLEAAHQRFATRVDQIPLLKNRAEAGGVTAIRRPDDLVPLLFAHSTYKSYGEAWLAGGQWDRMARWLQTVSTYEVGGQSFSDVDGLDAWVELLEADGRFVACSSGTTGKPAMLGATEADLDFASWANVSSFSWATGVAPAKDRKFFGLGPRTNVTRNERTREALVEAFCAETEEPYQLPVPIITTGAIMAMILLRRKIADGTATASEVGEFEQLSAQRLSGLEDAMADAVDELIKSREQKLFLSGMWASLHPLAVGVRDRGYSGADYRDDNTLFVGGGLKGANLPPDYRETVFDTFGLSDERQYQLYSMQEINTPFPLCRSGRYHVAPWVLALPLDASGEHLLDPTQGEVEGRAAFFDLSLDGRWGGVISGDRVTVDGRICACGAQGPTIGPEIVRYSDLDSGDKISCAGTIDAYVKGAV
jgi:hypothetical protein